MDKNVIWLIEKIHKINKQIGMLNDRQTETADMIDDLNKTVVYLLTKIK